MNAGGGLDSVASGVFRRATRATLRTLGEYIAAGAGTYPQARDGQVAARARPVLPFWQGANRG